MLKRSPGTRVRQVASGLALCAFSVASLADPISLTGSCRLTSILAGQGRCELSVAASDDFLNPSTVRLGQIKVDGVVVLQFVNDGQNPVDFAVPYVSTSTEVACNVSHTVTAWIAPVSEPPGSPTAYARVGSLPAVKCPAAP